MNSEVIEKNIEEAEKPKAAEVKIKREEKPSFEIVESDIEKITFSEFTNYKGNIRPVYFHLNQKGIDGSERQERIRVPYFFDYNILKQKINFKEEDLHAELMDSSVKVSYVVKELMFAYPNTREKAMIENIFKKTDAKTLLVIRRRNSLQYIPNPETKTIIKKYEFEHKLLSRLENKPEISEASEAEQTEIANMVEQLALRGILKEFFESNNVEMNMGMKQIDQLNMKYINRLFNEDIAHGVGDAIMEEDIRDLLYSEAYDFEQKETYYKKLKKIINEKFPLQKLVKALENGDIELPFSLADKVEASQKAEPLYIDYGSSNGESLNAAKEHKNMQALVFDKDATSNSFYSDEIREAFRPHGGVDQHSIIRSIYKDVQGIKSFSPKSKTIHNSFSRLVSPSGHHKMSLLNTTLPGTVFYKCKDKEEATDILQKEIFAGERPGIPAMIDGQYYIVFTEPKHKSDAAYSAFTTEKDKKDDEALAKNVIDSLVDNDLNSMFNYTVDNGYARNMSRIKQEHFSQGAKHFISGSMGLFEKATYIETYTGKGHTQNIGKVFAEIIEEEFKKVPNATEVSALVANVPNEEIMKNFIEIDPGDKVFPNIQSVEGAKISLWDIANSPFYSSYYMATEEISGPLRDIMLKHNLAVPETHPFELDLIDLSKNKLPEHKKEVVIDPSKPSGILEFKYLPIFIKVDTPEAKEKFLELASKTISKSFGETDPGTIKNIEEMVRDNYADALKEATRIVTKIEAVRENGNQIVQKERLVLIDKNYDEIAIGNTPVFPFYDTLKEEGILKKEDRVKKATFKAKHISDLFDAVDNMLSKVISDSPEYFERVKKLHGAYISSLNQQRIESQTGFEKIEPKEDDPFSFYKLIKKGELDQYTGELYAIKPRSAKEVVNAVFGKDEAIDKQMKTVKETALKVLERVYVGNEFNFANKNLKENHISQLKNILFGANATKEQEGMAHKLVNTLENEAIKDINIIKSTTKMINIFAFKNYVHLLKGKKENEGKGLTPQEKNALFTKFLSDIFELLPHQLIEVKGMMALHMSGHKNVHQLWWEARAMKTLVSVALIFLKGLLTKTNGMLFPQPKNFEDIIQQAFNMFPPLIGMYSTLLGAQKTYTTKTDKYPLSVTKWVFPNIPVKLKRTNLLSNPLVKSSEAPAEVLARTFFKDINMIFKEAQGMSDEAMEEVFKKNKKYLKSVDMFQKNIPEGDIQKTLARSFYFYIIRLIKTKFIPSEKDSKDLVPELNKIFSTFWKHYIKDLNNLKDGHGEMVFIGKQFISSFDAQKEAEKIYKFGEGTPQVITDADVDITKHKPNDPNVLKKFINAIGLPEEDMPKNGGAIFPQFRQGDHKTKHSTEAIFKSAMFYLTEDLRAELQKVMDVEMKDTLVSKYGESLYEEVLQSLGSKIGGLVGQLRKALKENKDYCEEAFLPYLKKDGDFVPGISFDTKDFLTKNLKHFIPVLDEIEDEDIRRSTESVFAKTILDPAKISAAISDNGYKMVASALYMPGHDIAAITKNRMAIFVKNGENTRSADISVVLKFIKPIKDVCFPIKDKGSKEGANKYDQAVCSISAVYTKDGDPSELINKELYPAAITIDFNRILGYRMVVDGIAKDFKPEKRKTYLFTEKNKEYSSNLSSSILWNIELPDDSRKMGAIGIDETHKNLSPKIAHSTRELIRATVNSEGESKENSEYDDLPALSVNLTGTVAAKIENLSKNISVTSGEMAKGAEKDIIKYCANFKIEDEVLAFLITDAKKIKGLDKLTGDALSAVIAKIYKEGSKVNLYNEAKELYSNIKSDSDMYRDMQKFFSKEGSYLSSHEIINKFEDILREASRQALSDIRKKADLSAKDETRTLRAEGSIRAKDKDFIRDTKERVLMKEISSYVPGLNTFASLAMATNSRMVTIDAGFSNPMGLARFMDYAVGAHISIRRSSEDVAYEILDSGINREMEIGDVSEEAKAILTFNDILRKYRRRFSIDGIYNSYSALVDIVLKGIKENSESLLHMDIKELNRIINRTQAAKKDSFADYMRNAIKEGESFPREMDDIVVLVSRGVDHIIGQKKEIAKMRSSANEDEKCAIEFLPGINTEISVDDIRAISFSHRIGNRNCTIEESGAKPTRTNKEVISVSPTGFSYSYSEDDSKPVVKKEIKYYTPVSVQPFEELPPVHFNANISLDDDNSIFEAAAFSAESSATLLGSINKGNNTRNMTTRTAISKLGILETLYALMNRDDKSRKANLLVSNSNQEVNSFYRMLIKDYEHVFKKHNIEVHAISANTLNNIADPLVKKREGVHIVGNSLSFDVGVKMDYVQEGTYRGVLTNISATVQSFARQIGKAQDVSRFNIYNNGYAKKISCPSKTGVTVNDNIEQNIIDGIAVDSTEATKEALRKRFTGASSPVWQEIGKVLDGYTVKLNKQTEKNFRGFEVFVTGMPIVEDLSKYEGVERTKKIAEITSMRTSKVYLGDKIEGEKPLTGISKNENTEEVASLAPSKIAL